MMAATELLSSLYRKGLINDPLPRELAEMQKDLMISSMPRHSYLHGESRQFSCFPVQRDASRGLPFLSEILNYWKLPHITPPLAE